MMDRFKPILMLSMHILLPKQSNFKTLGQFENSGFLIMSTRENIRLIARAPCTTINLINSNLIIKRFFLIG